MIRERIEGLEPSAFAMATRRSSQLSYIRLADGLSHYRLIFVNRAEG